MKKQITCLSFFLMSLVTLQGQVVQESLPGAEEISNRRTSFNLDEIKVRWKKAALENCTGVPCTTGPGTGGPFTCGTSTVSDIDGNSYNTVSIGTQCWTKSNLKVTKYNDGTNIPLDATGGPTGNVGSSWVVTTGARTVYGHDPAKLASYGYLYNWYAATDSKKLCPSGWHVPDSTEWGTLRDFLGGPLLGGGKMKVNGTNNWIAGTVGDNSSGFSAEAGGQRAFNDSFFDDTDHAYYWSITPKGTGPALYAWEFSLYFSNTRVTKYDNARTAGNSIRCLKD
jgi:uncharacterized protein (TIGR02145 family)